MGLIETSFTQLEVDQLIPSFFTWLFGGALNLEQGGIWGICLLLVVAMVSFLSLKNYSTDRAMIVSSMVTWIVALLSLKAGWINNFIFTLSCIYVVVSMIALYGKRSQEEA